jgi:hypothetical protein
VNLLEVMMQALLIRKMAQPTTIKRLERLERDYARLAGRASGPMQRLGTRCRNSHAPVAVRRRKHGAAEGSRRLARR